MAGQKQPLKIVSFQARNTKRLKAVRIDPDPDKSVVILTGKNRQGKTSILDSIWFALGGERSIPAKPIREGESDALVSLDLGDFIVERRFTPNGSYLEVKTKEGFSAKSPQTFLSSRLGSRAQNPLEFLRLKPEEQVKTLQSMIDIKLDLAEFELISGLSTKNVKIDDPIALIDSGYRNLYEKRTDVNKEVTRLEGTVKTVRAEIPKDRENTLPVSVTELFEKRKVLELLRESNQAEVTKIQDIFKAFDQRMHEMTMLDKRIEETEILLTQLREMKGALALKIDVLDADYQAQSDRIDTLTEPDFTDIDSQIAAADETNKIAESVKKLREHAAELEAEKTKSEDLTNKLASIKDYKGKLITEAGLPVPGLGFQDGEVTYNGIPLSQASTAEQIQISCAICMANHPGIGVLTIDVGWSELDSESQKVLLDWAEKIGCQVWVTRVTDEPGEDGFFIEDGELKAIDGQLVEVPIVVPVNGDWVAAEVVADPIPF